MVRDMIPWRRLWHPRGVYPQLDFDGYLADPDQFNMLTPNVTGLDKLHQSSCLVLLGEPGMGKSTAMREAFDAERAGSPQDLHLFKDLGQFTTDVALLQTVFGDERYVEWLRGDSRLHLFLDSLDECLLRIDTVAAILGEKLAAAPDRLSLRIACRGAEWPVYLEKRLGDRFGSSLGVYELAPLRHDDVALAAEKTGIDPGEFMAHVAKRDAVALAIRPVTLRFLLNTYRRSNIPPTRRGLYLEGCRLLCEETSETRLASVRLERPDVQKRLRVAARIAAVMMFARKSAVWLGPDLGDRPDSDVPIRDIASSNTGETGSTTGEDVRDTLSSSLFIGLDPNRLAFAHQTYAEFLAAHFVVENGMEPEQILSLISHPGDSDGRLVPQLAETAAWISEMDDGMFQRILNRDPQVLLRSDVATASNDDKKRLVSALLRSFDSGEILDDVDLRDHYRKLNHPGIAADLQPYVTTRSKEIVVRRAAIDIAELCPDAWQLQSVLADLALDTSEFLQVREQAAHAVAAVADDANRQRLEPLVSSSDTCDENDNLKGIAMRALWPTFVSGRALFAALSPPKHDSYFGAYESFISGELRANLDREDLAQALQWVARQPRRHDLPLSFRRLMDRTFELAFGRLDELPILAEVTNAIISRLRTFDELIEHQHRNEMTDILASDREKRLTLLLALAPQLPPESNETLALVYGAARLALPEDIPAIVARLRHAPNGSEVPTLAHVVNLLFCHRFDHLDVILEAIPVIPALRNELGVFLQPVEIESARGREMRDQWLKHRRLIKSAPLPPITPPLAARVEGFLSELEQGDLDAWWKLNFAMAIDPSGGQDINEFHFDITTLPSWKAASDDTRRRIVCSAEAFVKGAQDNRDQWLGQQVFHRPAAAGYRALLLLQRVAPDFLASLTSETWRKWAGAVVEFAERGGEQGKGMGEHIVCIAYRHAPREVIDVLLRLTDAENGRGNNLYAIDKVQSCWDERIGSALLPKVKDVDLKPSCLRDLLDVLLKHRVDGAMESAFALTKDCGGSDPFAKERAQVAATSLLLQMPAESWAEVWPLITADESFGKQVLESVAGSRPEHRKGQPVGQLPEEPLADLYIWLERYFPKQDDPKHDGSYMVGPREAIAELRDQVLHELQERGTVESRRAFARIVRTLDHIPWLKWAFVRARQRTLESTWTPPAPRDVLQLARDRKSRLVESPSQLMDVVQEALERLNEELQGETPAAPDCWDKDRPKDEEAISNYIKRYLEKDLMGRGIVINREVQIRRGEADPGERLDIKVDAIARDDRGNEFDKLSVIIEVKGVWNTGVEDAMKLQLRDRYLKDNACQHGLYVVVWPMCAAWDSSDPRYARTRKWTKERAQQVFARQAADLSGGDVALRSMLLDISLR